MYAFLPNGDLHAQKFAIILGQEINKMKSGELDSHLELQKQVYAPRWSWNERIQEWINYLDTLILNEPLTSEPTSETSPNSLATISQNVGA
jgi:hypothetical protein